MSLNNNFFNQLDKIIHDDAPVTPKRHRAAKEGLDSNSSTEDFIQAIATAVASFILDNRQAFDTDDEKAAQEYAAVLAVPDVQQRVLEILSSPEPTEEEESADDVLPEPLPEDVSDEQSPEDKAAAAADKVVNRQPASGDVPADVMKLLEE